MIDWYDEGALEGCHEVVSCPECPSELGVADARVWRLEHNADGSHTAVTMPLDNDSESAFLSTPEGD
ncbi:hypothetical protein ABC195_09490 [Microbacterium sp. 2P01SA-2]|uniref:hypothetical protein n=1 Tax=unclassified Microbacterium TaxID=2609290 RepID=UPI0039A2F9BF